MLPSWCLLAWQRHSRIKRLIDRSSLNMLWERAAALLSFNEHDAEDRAVEKTFGFVISGYLWSSCYKMVFLKGLKTGLVRVPSTSAKDRSTKKKSSSTMNIFTTFVLATLLCSEYIALFLE